MNCVRCACEMKKALFFGGAREVSVLPKEAEGIMWKVGKPEYGADALVCPQCGVVELRVRHPELYG